MISISLLIAVVVILVVPPVVWWSVTHVVPRVLETMGLLGKGELQAQEVRLQRIEEAIDALAIQLERVAQHQRTSIDRGSESVPRDPELR